jgi:hypothetical protein
MTHLNAIAATSTARTWWRGRTVAAPRDFEHPRDKVFALTRSGGAEIH